MFLTATTNGCRQARMVMGAPVFPDVQAHQQCCSVLPSASNCRRTSKAPKNWSLLPKKEGYVHMTNQTGGQMTDLMSSVGGVGSPSGQRGGGATPPLAVVLSGDFQQPQTGCWTQTHRSSNKGELGQQSYRFSTGELLSNSRPPEWNCCVVQDTLTPACICYLRWLLLCY